MVVTERELSKLQYEFQQLANRCVAMGVSYTAATQEMRYALVRSALKRSHGWQSKAAKLLGLSRNAIRLHIPPDANVRRINHRYND